jgi:hypothetical protein
MQQLQSILKAPDYGDTDNLGESWVTFPNVSPCTELAAIHMQISKFVSDPII